jgi:hypothetical protein
VNEADCDDVWLRSPNPKIKNKNCVETGRRMRCDYQMTLFYSPSLSFAFHRTIILNALERVKDDEKSVSSLKLTTLLNHPRFE